MKTKELKTLLRDLVVFKSYEPREINACIDYIENYLKKGGVRTEVLTNGGLKSLVAWAGPAKGKTIILNAHIDVVQNDPQYFSLKEEGDKLIGPGLFDMKASGAVLMQLLVELKDAPLPCRIMAQFVPDEEVGGKLGTGYLVEQGYVGDFLICLEPTHLKLSIQCKGCLWMEVRFPGKAAHGSRPWLGESAVEKAFACYQDLLKLPYIKASSPFFKQATVALTTINGGDSRNKIPDHCTVSFDIRYLPEQTREEVLAQIEPVLKKYNAEWRELSHGYPVVTTPDNPFVKQLFAATQEHWPDTIIFGQDGSSDARYYTPVGVPGIEWEATNMVIMSLLISRLY
jgi:succinyl-diaminopimelate desuccinylase